MASQTPLVNCPAGTRSEFGHDFIEWIGTAYARRRAPEPLTGSAPISAVPLASNTHPVTSKVALTDAKKNWRLLMSAVAAATALAVLIVLALPVLPNSSLEKLSVPGGPDTIPLAFSIAAQGDQAIEDSARRERAGETVAQLEAQISQLKRTNQNSESAILAERVARQTAETETAMAKEKLAHQSRSTTPGIAPAANNERLNNSTDGGAHNADRQNSQSRKASDFAFKAASAKLAAGRKLFVAGHVVEARAHFMLAAEIGLPEAALAVGNTFDPASLAKFNLQKLSDITRARQWYHRAYMASLRQRQQSEGG